MLYDVYTETELNIQTLDTVLLLSIWQSYSIKWKYCYMHHLIHISIPRFKITLGLNHAQPSSMILKRCHLGWLRKLRPIVIFFSLPLKNDINDDFFFYLQNKHKMYPITQDIPRVQKKKSNIYLIMIFYMYLQDSFAGSTLSLMFITVTFLPSTKLTKTQMSVCAPHSVEAYVVRLCLLFCSHTPPPKLLLFADEQ